MEPLFVTEAPGVGLEGIEAGERIACIGSRRLSAEQAERCRQVGARLAGLGALVVSGGAEGADLAFVEGALEAGGKALCVLPWSSYNAALIPDGCERLVFNPAVHQDWLEMAREQHPAWGRLSQGARRLHARNSGILVGEAPSQRVSAVIAQRAADRRGGTEQGLRLARALGVRLIDLDDPTAFPRVTITPVGGGRGREDIWGRSKQTSGPAPPSG